ncbi:MAG: class I SAM-dependent methyltransferase [Planctomycetota bacterium]|jgi:ubiquinone/menaquinone biosynthesis C-methylase UbiE
MTDIDRIQNYYGEFDEWGRLDTPDGQIVLERMSALLARFLQPGGRILDLASGPGRYAIELARNGHRVALGDLCPRLLQIAREKIEEAGVANMIDSIDEINAIDLGIYPDEGFDAVLAMGPFYHLGSEDERGQAAREIARILKPNGLVFVDFIPRLTGVKGLIERYAADPEQVTPEALAEAFRSGVFRNAAPRGFQEGYYAEADEIRELFESVGFISQEIVSLRSIAFMHEEALLEVRQKSPELYAEVVSIMDKTASDPRVIAMSGSAVYIGHKG